MIAKGYYRTNYHNHTIEVEKLEGEWWTTIDGIQGFEPRELRRWAIEAAKKHVDATARGVLVTSVLSPVRFRWL